MPLQPNAPSWTAQYASAASADWSGNPATYVQIVGAGTVVLVCDDGSTATLECLGGEVFPGVFAALTSTSATYVNAGNGQVPPATPPNGTAAGVAIADAGGYFTGSNVEAALQQLAGAPGAQAAWYVNSSTGSDTAAGTVSAPLLTVGELLRRLRGVTVTAATVDVYLTGSFAAETLDFDITLDSNVYFTIYGARTAVLTGTLTAGTRNWDSATPQDGRIVSSGLTTSWTAALGANLNGLIKITTAGGDATAWISKDLGSKTARISCPMLADFTPATIASGDVFTVYALTALGADVTFNLTMGHGAYLAIYDCEVGTAGALHGVEVIGGNSNFITCSINGLDLYGNTTAAALGCKFANGPRPQRGAALNSYYDLAISTSSSAQCRDGAQFYASNLTCQGMQFVCAGGTTIVASGSWLAVYDPNVSASGNGVDVLAGATLKSIGRIFGSTTATGTNSGIFVDACGNATYNTSAANLLPAITGATNDTKIGGTVKTYAQLPYTDTTNGAAFGGTTFPRG